MCPSDVMCCPYSVASTQHIRGYTQATHSFCIRFGAGCVAYFEGGQHVADRRCVAQNVLPGQHMAGWSGQEVSGE